MTDATRFQVASLTKIVTAIATLSMVAEGVVDLDEPIGPRLRRWELPPLPASVTLRRLLSHTSGLPSGASPGVPPSEERPRLEDVVAGRAGMPPAVPIGDTDRFQYSNPGYALIELAIEDLTGATFASSCEDRVLMPLGMRTTSFSPRPGDALPHHRAGKRLPQAVSNHLASGGLFASVGDLALLARAMCSDGHPVLPASMYREMVTVAAGAEGAFMIRNGGYGFGVVTGRLPGGTTFIGNQGSRPGFRSLLVCLPRSGDALAVAANSDSGSTLLAHVATRWLLNRRRSSQRKPPLTSTPNTLL